MQSTVDAQAAAALPSTQPQNASPPGQPGRGRAKGRAGRAAHGKQSDSSAGSSQAGAVSSEANLSIGSPANGHIANVRDTFGFLRISGSPEALFFHCTDVLVRKEGSPQLVPLSFDEGVRINLHQHLSAGDQVEFVIGPGQRNALFSAKQVKVTAKAAELAAAPSTATDAPANAPAAPQTDIPPPPLFLPQDHSLVGSLQGTVKQLPDFSAASRRARQEALDGRLTYIPEAPDKSEASPVQEELPFGAADLSTNKGRLQVGDLVTFVISDRWEGKRATKLQLVPGSREQKQAEQPMAATRVQGFVNSFNHNSGRGSIRRADGEGQLAFSIQAVVEASRVHLTHTSEVEFALGREGRKDVAVGIVCLPAGTLRQEESLPGRLTGRVVRAPAVPQGQTRERPGTIRCDDADLGSVISFSSEQARKAVGGVPSDGDDVEFSRMLRRRSGAVWAVDMALTCRAADRRELGQVAVLKPKFGFIKCCERRSDLFFHFTALAEGLSASDLAVGDDVEFFVGAEPPSEERPAPRAIAFEVAKAPKGSAIFETLSEERLTGLVYERLQSNGFTTVSSGVLEYEDAASGQKARLTFNADDLVGSEIAFQPQQGDRVTFRLAMRVRDVQDAQALGGSAARHAGRRATEVDLQRFKGTCYVWKTSYGFIEVVNAHELGIKGRLYFNAGDVTGTVPAAGQPVSGHVASNPQGEVIARAVKVLPAQPAMHVQPAREPVAAPEEAPPSAAPQRPKLQLKSSARAGEAGKKAPAARIAAGPDGTRGFTTGRGRALPAAPSCIAPPAPPPGMPPAPPRTTSGLKLTLSGSLNPTATEFVPTSSLTRAMSSQSTLAASDSNLPALATPAADAIPEPGNLQNGHSSDGVVAEAASPEQIKVPAPHEKAGKFKSAEDAVGAPPA